MVDFDVGVVLPAAGSGNRIGGVPPKQYHLILGKPLFLYSLEEFDRLPYVKKIVLVVDSPEHVNSLLEDHYTTTRDKIVVVQGEPTRHRSIRAGVLALQKCESNLKVVIVHDAVRPLMPKSIVETLILAAEQHGAAGTTRPLVSTVVKPSSEGFLDHSLDRSKHLASETPQAFQLDVLTAAFSKCTEEDLDTGTECLYLVQQYSGIKPRLIDGPEDLWKVTYKKDIYAAIGCLKEKMNQVCIIAPEENETVRLLIEALGCRVSVVRQVRSPADPVPHSPRERFNTAVFFHTHEIDQESELFDLVAMLDVERRGLIIHIIEQTNADGMQSMSVYDLHRSGRTMARQYDKLKKGVVIIHCLTPGEDKRLADLVANLVLSETDTFSGQTLFL